MGLRPRTRRTIKETLRSARAVLPMAAQMEEMYSGADHWIARYAFDSDPKPWNTEVFFGGRYSLSMKVDVEIDYAANRITRVVGEPAFRLREARRNMPADGTADESFRDEERHFTAEAWKKLYEAKGDYSVIGIQINPEPVANFDDAVSRLRSGRLQIRLLDQ